jgi:hypothetical protein
MSRYRILIQELPDAKDLKGSPLSESSGKIVEAIDMPSDTSSFVAVTAHPQRPGTVRWIFKSQSSVGAAIRAAGFKRLSGRLKPSDVNWNGPPSSWDGPSQG